MSEALEPTSTLTAPAAHDHSQAAHGGPRPFLRRNAGIARRATSSLDARYTPKGGFILEVTEHKPKVSKGKLLRQARLQKVKQAPGVLKKALAPAPASAPARAVSPTTPVKVSFQEAASQPKPAAAASISTDAPANTSALSLRLKSMLSSVTQTRQEEAAPVSLPLQLLDQLS